MEAKAEQETAPTPSSQGQAGQVTAFTFQAIDS